MIKPLIAALLSLLGVGLAFIPEPKPSPTTPTKAIAKTTLPLKDMKFKMLKDVGEAYMDHFGLTDQDFTKIREAGVSVIESNFDICATDEDVKYFLNQSHKNGLKVIMPAGSGEAEWGYACNQSQFPRDQAPSWQADRVKAWVNKWKGHPAIFAWDISNEAGSVFPNASWNNDENGKVPDALYLTASGLQQAYKDVKAVDPSRPVMIRMNGWFFYDFKSDFFRSGNPFAKDVADIVMVNAYSNVDEYFGDFVATVMNRAISSINQIDPDTRFIVALGVWNEPPLWRLPSIGQFQSDITQLNRVETPIGISFFKYGAAGSEWYLPQNANSLWEEIKKVKF